jgi:hypothetical protein
MPKQHIQKYQTRFDARAIYSRAIRARGKKKAACGFAASGPARPAEMSTPTPITQMRQ